MKKRVAAYARVSTDKDDQTNSFESQVRYFKSYIDREDGWDLVKIYADEGISGTQTVKRQGFNDMIADALSGKIDLIITKEVSRFARNVLDSIAYTRKLRDHGVYIRFVLDGIDTEQADAELRLTFMSALAQEESRKTSERVKWGQKRQMEKGVVFGRSMLGYQVEGGKLYLVEEEARIVRLIFHKYLVEGKGTHVIARELKEAGIMPYRPDGHKKFKNDWSNTVILRILRNEKYVGDLCQKKTWTKSFLDHKKRYNRGEEDMVYIKDHHPDIAIVDRETWEETQKELKRRSSTPEQKAKHSNRYWASGKVFCGVCGERFLGRKKNTSLGVTRAWACSTHAKAAAFRVAECSMSEWASDKSLKACVLYVLGLLIQDKESILREMHDEIKRITQEPARSDNLGEVEARINDLESKKVKLIDLRLADEITSEELKMQKDSIDEEISTLKERFSDLKDKAEKGVSQNKRIQTILAEAENLLRFEKEEAETMLGTVLEKIIVYEGHTVEVYLKDIPLVFRLKYVSTGKLDSYRTQIISCDVS